MLVEIACWATGSKHKAAFGRNQIRAERVESLADGLKIYRTRLSFFETEKLNKLCRIISRSERYNARYSELAPVRRWLHRKTY